jgi:hypothetical protein
VLRENEGTCFEHEDLMTSKFVAVEQVLSQRAPKDPADNDNVKRLRIGSTGRVRSASSSPLQI